MKIFLNFNHSCYSVSSLPFNFPKNASKNGSGFVSLRAWHLIQSLKLHLNSSKKVKDPILDMTVDVSKNKADKTAESYSPWASLPLLSQTLAPHSLVLGFHKAWGLGRRDGFGRASGWEWVPASTRFL